MILASSVRTALVLLLSFGALACDGGYSDEEARAVCDQEWTARGGPDGGCITEENYQECIAAYTECGEDVVIGESCPTVFACSNLSEEPAQGE